MVPAPAHSPMPEKQALFENRAKLFSVYMRPWVLDPAMATEEVPHISNLNFVGMAAPVQTEGIKSEPKRRLRHKQVCPNSYRTAQELPRSFQDAWRGYIRGNVVSCHSKRLIVQFLAASCGKAKQVEQADEDSGRMERTHELPNNELPLQRVHAILDKMSAARDSSRADEQTPRDETLEPEDLLDAKADQSQNVNDAMQLTAKLWARDASVRPACGIDARSMWNLSAGARFGSWEVQ
jgi:hypothetical protein